MMGPRPGDGDAHEAQARLRERIAGIEKEIPLLRQSTGEQIANLRHHIDERLAAQNVYIDSKFADLGKLINAPPPRDTRIWWTMFAVGALCALTLIAVMAMWITQKGASPL